MIHMSKKATDKGSPLQIQLSGQEKVDCDLSKTCSQFVSIENAPQRPQKPLKDS